MEKEKPFGISKEEFEYIDRYVILSPFNGGSNHSVGKLVNIDKGFYILNPHQGVGCDKEKGWLDTIVKENEYVPVCQTRVRPITKKSFESSIFLNNKERKKARKKD